MNKKTVEMLATWFYTGNAKKAPGTIGTLGAIPLYIFVYMFKMFGIIKNEMLFNGIYFFLLIVLFFFGSYICEIAERVIYKEKDPQNVVIDEVLGYMTTMFLINPQNAIQFVINILLGFVLFRIFDILKPGPIDKIQKLRDGVGVMADDFLAGIVANIILVGVNLLWIRNMN